MALVLDTGVVIALVDADDSHHGRCVALAEATLEDLVVPGTALPEIDYFLRKRGLSKGWLALVEDVTAGAYRLHWPDDAGIAEPCRRQCGPYPRPLQTVGVDQRQESGAHGAGI